MAVAGRFSSKRNSGAPPWGSGPGYEDQVLLMAAVRPPERLKQGESTKITAQVHYLVCHDVCIPAQKHLELSLPVKTSATFSPARPLFVAARQKLPRPMPRNWKIDRKSV